MSFKHSSQGEHRGIFKDIQDQYNNTFKLRWKQHLFACAGLALDSQNELGRQFHKSTFIKPVQHSPTIDIQTPK